MRRVLLTLVLLFGVTGIIMVVYYQNGLDVVTPDDCATADAKVTEAAVLGDTVAQYNLGLMYDEGPCVPQDNAQAFGTQKLLRLAIQKPSTN